MLSYRDLKEIFSERAAVALVLAVSFSAVGYGLGRAHLTYWQSANDVSVKKFLDLQSEMAEKVKGIEQKQEQSLMNLRAERDQARSDRNSLKKQIDAANVTLAAAKVEIVRLSNIVNDEQRRRSSLEERNVALERERLLWRDIELDRNNIELNLRVSAIKSRIDSGEVICISGMRSESGAAVMAIRKWLEKSAAQGKVFQVAEARQSECYKKVM